jgi:hypothetical protein
MKNKKTLLYDDACPLCSWYSGAFVKSGLLDKEGRKAFSLASPELLQCINAKRGVNEIPLIDHDTKQVLYGIDALVAIIGQRCPIVRVLGKTVVVKWPLKKLYNFISYNRKVIVARKRAEGRLDCSPDFNVFYRFLFMSIFLCFNTLMLFPLYAELLSKIPGVDISLLTFHGVHAVILCSNCLLAFSLSRKEAIEYLGQVNMLALITILLLIPLMWLNEWWRPIGSFNLIYLGLLSIFIVKEYFRRMEYAGVEPYHKNIVFVNLVSMALFATSLFVL